MYTNKKIASNPINLIGFQNLIRKSENNFWIKS